MRRRNSVILFLLFVIAGSALACSEDETKAPEDHGISPYSLAAVVEGSSVAEVTQALTHFIHEIDDTTRGLPADWTVIGANQVHAGAGPEAAALNLPNGSRIIEVCNHSYAAQAMSMGPHNGVALPCKIAVYQEGNDVKVILLNPEAIFGAFFRDLTPDQIAGMGGLAAQVRGELEGLISAALADHGASFPREDVGPRWSAEDMAAFGDLPISIANDLTIPEAYRGDGAQREAFKALFIATMLEVATHEDAASVGSQVAGLSVADWRAARTHAVSLPTGVDLIQLCSPTYANAALAMGAEHAPALPCRVALWVEGDVLRIAQLDTGFVFPVFFSNAPAEMQEAMAGMAAMVRQDVTSMVDAAKARLAADEG